MTGSPVCTHEMFPASLFRTHKSGSIPKVGQGKRRSVTFRFLVGRDQIAPGKSRQDGGKATSYLLSTPSCRSEFDSGWLASAVRSSKLAKSVSRWLKHVVPIRPVPVPAPSSTVRSVLVSDRFPPLGPQWRLRLIGVPGVLGRVLSIDPF
jgi:hypothetical protein